MSNNFMKIGPTVTMFVPYDCNNMCPFCVNKKEYQNQSDFNIDKCYQSLNILNRIFPYNDIVLTGGEPLAELDMLGEILEHIPDTHHIYINTTMPVADDDTIQNVANTLNQYLGKIDCINVSRHLEHYVKECSDEIFDLLEIPHRINCVIYNSASIPKTRDKLVDFLDRFNNHNIQLRANYSLLSLENVFDTEHDTLYKLIASIADYDGQLEQERFRTGYLFHRGGSEITYHKTLPFSKVDGIVGDIIVKQNGEIYDDWNEYGKHLDLNDLVQMNYCKED